MTNKNYAGKEKTKLFGTREMKQAAKLLLFSPPESMQVFQLYILAMERQSYKTGHYQKRMQKYVIGKELLQKLY